MIWAMMQHLGYYMWHDEAIWRGPGRMKWSNFCTDHLLCTDSSWNLRMKRLLEPDMFVLMKSEMICLSEKYPFVNMQHLGFRNDWKNTL